MTDKTDTTARRTLTIHGADVDRVEDGIAALADTLRGLTSIDIGIQEPLHAGALALAAQTAGELAEIVELARLAELSESRKSKPDNTETKRRMRQWMVEDIQKFYGVDMSEVARRLNERDEARAEPVKPEPVQGKPDTNEATRMHHAGIMSRIEDGLIRLGMIGDLVAYLSDAEGQGMKDGRGSTLDPTRKGAALTLIAWELNETQERMREAVRADYAARRAA